MRLRGLSSGASTAFPSSLQAPSASRPLLNKGLAARPPAQRQLCGCTPCPILSRELTAAAQLSPQGQAQSPGTTWARCQGQAERLGPAAQTLLSPRWLCSLEASGTERTLCSWFRS